MSVDFRGTFEKLVKLGTAKSNGYHRNHQIRLLNLVCLSVCCAIAPHLMLTIRFGAAAASIAEAAAILGLVSTIMLNARGGFSVARVVALMIGNCHILLMTLLLGVDSGVHLYLSAAIIAPFLFFERAELGAIIGFAAASVVIAIVIQAVDFEPLIPAPVELLSGFYYCSLMGTLCTVFGFVYYFHGESNRLRQLLEWVSKTDSLTMLPNRRDLDSKLEEYWSTEVKAARSMSVIMLDVDWFGRYNIKYGHPKGDRCLSRVASVLANAIGHDGMPARYGGEEFIVVMPNMDIASAAGTAERIRRDIEDLGIEHVASSYGVVTCSVGVASMIPTLDRRPEELVELADDYLLKAKENGRNRVEVAPVSSA